MEYFEIINELYARLDKPEPMYHLNSDIGEAMPHLLRLITLLADRVEKLESVAKNAETRYFLGLQDKV